MSTATADRIAALRAEGEAAVAAAASTADLEEIRVRFLGRKAELPNLLRDVGKLPPEERGPVGKGANQARQALQAAVDSRQAELEAVELETKLAADVVDVTLPGTPVAPAGHLHILTATRREIEDVFVGLGFTVVEGPEIDLAYYNFDALNHDAQPPGALARPTRSTSPTTSSCARRPRRCRSARWSCSRRRCTSSSRAASTGPTTTRRTRRSSTRSRASPSTRT